MDDRARGESVVSARSLGVARQTDKTRGLTYGLAGRRWKKKSRWGIK